MDNFEKKVLEYKKDNNLTIDNCAEELKMEKSEIENIEKGNLTTLSEAEQSRIMSDLSKKNGKGTKRLGGILDLIFRMGATIMALAVLLLCIRGNTDSESMITLLSIGLVFASITGLPRNEK